MATLSCLDTRSGYVRWQTNMRRSLQFPALEMGELTGYCSSQHLVVLDTKTGEQVSCILLPRVMPVAPLVYSDGAVYGCSIGSRAFRMDLDTGRDVWGLQQANYVRALLEAPLCFKDAVVFVSLEEHGAVHAVRKDTGETLWDYVVGSDLTAPAAFGETVLVGSADRSLYALALKRDAKETEVTPKWQFTADGSLFEPVQVVGELGFLPCRHRGLHVLDLKDGKQKWFVAGQDVRLLARGKRRAYLGFGDRTIAVVDVENGKLIWQLLPERYTIFIPNLRTNMLYLASPEGAVIALKER